MAGTNHPNLVIRALHQAKNGFGQRFHRSSRRLLHKNVAVVAMLKRVQHQVNRIGQRHHEAGHVRVGQGDGLVHAFVDAVDGDGNGLGGRAVLAGDGELVGDLLSSAQGLRGRFAVVQGVDQRASGEIERD